MGKHWMLCGTDIYGIKLRVLTPANIEGSTSSNWATHSVIGGKDKSEYTGPGLKSYQLKSSWFQSWA